MTGQMKSQQAINTEISAGWRSSFGHGKNGREININKYDANSDRFVRVSNATTRANPEGKFRVFTGYGATGSKESKGGRQRISLDSQSEAMNTAEIWLNQGKRPIDSERFG